MKTRVYIASVKSLENQVLFSGYYSQVPEYRQKKVDVYKTAKDKRLSLGAGLLLSRALKDSGIDEDSLEPSKKENGRPFFKNRPEVYFSLSHSEDMVMCAISDASIGCDVEKLKDGEIDIREWTKKESYVKASDTDMIQLLNDKITYEKKYFFKVIERNDGYSYTVCSILPVSDDAVEYVEFL